LITLKAYIKHYWTMRLFSMSMALRSLLVWRTLPARGAVSPTRLIADDQLFSRAVRLSDHILHVLLPPSSTTASQRYNLRHRAHSLHLS